MTYKEKLQEMYNAKIDKLQETEHLICYAIIGKGVLVTAIVSKISGNCNIVNPFTGNIIKQIIL